MRLCVAGTSRMRLAVPDGLLLAAHAEDYRVEFGAIRPDTTTQRAVSRISRRRLCAASLSCG